MRKLNQSGFSLIELMIVVAIIGILAAIAIPNFQTFQRKSRQSEARSLLGAYYSASSAASAEYNGHLGNFVAIGFQPTGRLTYRITAVNNGNVAFAVAANQLTNFNLAPSVPACVVTSALAATCVRPGYGIGANGWQENGATAVAPVGCVAANSSGLGNASTFTTCASANIGGAAVDTWRMTQAKVLDNPTPGI